MAKWKAEAMFSRRGCRGKEGVGMKPGTFVAEIAGRAWLCNISVRDRDHVTAVQLDPRAASAVRKSTTTTTTRTRHHAQRELVGEKPAAANAYNPR
ncbi:hypothetical protein AG1IA_01404 [Rhizoctonia solani AG-1 IA]|uniref:Uncharacterized protein n=1 Tax=Thanatephorus cucumeris (strain AG1-IA) TaxID=983506 RepID=L8X7E6_THACA|nr:hypothetical protein AG1IA_01404 [Rhizoctonia solani AG-1 IA]